MEIITFTKNNWENKFFYAKSYRFDQEVSFKQEMDCISNSRNKEFSDGFEYINIFLKNKYQTGITIEATLLFEHYGAPMICFCDNFDKDNNGNYRMRNYYEIVLFNEGINVWKLWMDDNKPKWTKLLFLDFKVSENEKHKLKITFLNDGIEINCLDKTQFLKIENMLKNFYLGIGACEEINRIYQIKLS